MHVELSGLTAIVLLLVGIDVSTNFKNGTSKLWTSYKSPIFLVALSMPLFFSSTVLFPFSSNWKLGIDPSSSACLQFLKSKPILDASAIHNPAMASLIAYADQKNLKPLCGPHPLYEGKEFMDSTLTPSYTDFLTWISIKNELLPNLILFRLNGESEQALNFLDERLTDGEWTMIYFDPLEAAILIRNLSEFQEIIDELRGNMK